MNQTDIAQILNELRSKHPGPAGECDLSDFELTLATVPEHSVWRIADVTPAVHALGPGDRLFTITLGDPPEPGLPGAVTLSVARIGNRLAPDEVGALDEIRAPAGQEPTPVPSDSRRTQVTDIWGNPLEKRRWRR